MIERRRFWWGAIFRPKDSKGRESRTLFFVGCTVGLIWLAIAAEIWQFVEPGSTMSAGDFAQALVALVGAFAVAVGVWLGREWIDAKRDHGDA